MQKQPVSHVHVESNSIVRNYAICSWQLLADVDGNAIYSWQLFAYVDGNYAIYSWQLFASVVGNYATIFSEQLFTSDAPAQYTVEIINVLLATMHNIQQAILVFCCWQLCNMQQVIIGF